MTNNKKNTSSEKLNNLVNDLKKKRNDMEIRGVKQLEGKNELPPTKDGRIYHGTNHEILDCLVADVVILAVSAFIQLGYKIDR